MLPRGGRAHSAARRAHQEAKLHQVRFVDVLNGHGILAGCRRKRVQPDRAAADVIIAGEEEIDELVLTLRAHHVTRLNALECSPEMGMTFVDILTDLERVSDHATNIMYAAFDDDCA